MPHFYYSGFRLITYTSKYLYLQQLFHILHPSSYFFSWQSFEKEQTPQQQDIPVLWRMKREHIESLNVRRHRNSSNLISLKIFVLHTSIVDKHISIKSISEENYILLVFEIYVSSCEEVRIKAEWTKTLTSG